MTNSAPTEDAVNADAVAWALASMAFVFLTTVLFGYSSGILVRVVSMAIVTLIWVVFGFAWAFYERPSPCLWALTFSLCKPYFLPLPLSQWKWTGPVSYSGIFGVHFAVKFLRSFLAGCQTGCLRCPLGIFHTIVVWCWNLISFVVSPCQRFLHGIASRQCHGPRSLARPWRIIREKVKL